MRDTGEARDVRIFGYRQMVIPQLIEAVGRDYLVQRFEREWLASVTGQGYSALDGAATQQEPMWWHDTLDADGEPTRVLLGFGQGAPDLYEFRVTGAAVPHAKERKTG